MSKILQSVRGTHDLLPEAAERHMEIIDNARRCARRYGYREIIPPMFEFSEVFHRTLGDSSDVIGKETYTFNDRGGESITLRPEFTASIARAYMQHGLKQQAPCKFFYAGPAFRYERPQKGRLRQFHQIGVEAIGVDSIQADYEVIQLALDTLSDLGIDRCSTMTEDCIKLELNTLGDVESRQQYRAALVDYLSRHRGELSEDSLRRLEHNPLRVLDSKDAGDKEIIKQAPILLDHLTVDADARFSALRKLLDARGVEYHVNPKLVRGLDYYCHTVFEVTTTSLGSQGTLLAGGRYDQLMRQMGGEETPSIGWAAGIERLDSFYDTEILRHEDARWLAADGVAVIPMNEDFYPYAEEVAHLLRRAGLNVDTIIKGSIKKALGRASALNVEYVVIIGHAEENNKTVTIKSMEHGGVISKSMQISVLLDKVKEGISRIKTEGKKIQISKHDFTKLFIEWAS